MEGLKIARCLDASSTYSGLRDQKRTRNADALRSKDRAWVEINLVNLRHNVKVLRAALPAKCAMMAVVKANAYGHGAVPVSTCLNRTGIRAFAVATIDEGIGLREGGVEGDILILGYTPAVRASEIFQYGLTQTVVDAEHASALNRFGKPVRVHIKVDTGMNRLGESCRNVAEIASIFDCKNLKVMGIFTHLCVPESLKKSDVAFTKQQIQCFYTLLDRLKEKSIKIPKIHIQGSYGVLHYPELQCNYARIGIALYGVLSVPYDTKRSLGLRPVLSLKARVSLIRSICKGESVGYGRSFVAQEEMKVAAISIGYADGYPRSLSSKAYVLVRGNRAPIIGRICMDQLMVDITGIPEVQRDDIVTLIGKDGLEEITAEQLAASGGTITNELLSRLSDSRLKRVYVNF